MAAGAPLAEPAAGGRRAPVVVSGTSEAVRDGSGMSEDSPGVTENGSRADGGGSGAGERPAGCCSEDFRAPQARQNTVPRAFARWVEAQRSQRSRIFSHSGEGRQVGQTRTCSPPTTARCQGLAPRTGSVCRALQRKHGMRFPVFEDRRRTSPVPCRDPREVFPDSGTPRGGPTGEVTRPAARRDYSEARALRYSAWSRASGMLLTTFQRTLPSLSMMKVPRREMPFSSLKTP